MAQIPKDGSPKRGDEDREAKLAQALRANLRRRKASKDDGRRTAGDKGREEEA